MIKEQSKIYFPNLDGLRFVAFFAVFFHHAVFIKGTGLDETTAVFHFLSAQEENGTLGVNLFFVLSGFLITYLLLNEKDRYSTIHVFNFYLRRVLKIWPLYFAMVVVGFLLFPILKQMLGDFPNETHSWGYYLFFISNFQMISRGFADSSILNILWSVGIEEQFYIFWPLILFFVSKKHLIKTFILFIVVSLIFRFYHAADTQVIYFHTLSVISDMVVGGLAAYAVLYSSKFKSIIKNMPTKYIAFTYAAGLLVTLFNYIIFKGTFMIMIERLVLSLFFAFIISEQNFSNHSFYKLSNNRFLTKWGNYTYGLYCLHTIGLLTAHVVISKLFKITHPALVMSCSFVIGLPVTMILALFSYHIFELPFLRLKNKFAYFTKNSTKE
jgi:peptidoglycan/LPS O-acetylase OafA/YrhL